MSNSFKVTVALVVLLASPPLQAMDEIDCESLSTLNSAQYASGFTALRELAIETNKKLCRAMLSTDRADEAKSVMLGYSLSAQALLRESFADNDFPMLRTQFDCFEAKLGAMGQAIDHQAIDQLKVGIDGALNTELYFSANTLCSRSTVPATLDTKCQSVPGSSQRYADCKDALDDASRAFNAYRHAYDQYRYDLNASELHALSESWGRFLTEARAQTLLDVIVTTWVTRAHFAQNKLVGPPSTQYFVLRPQVVYEYVGSAPKGDKDRIALAAEWAGVNWWDASIPFGASAVSIYTDEGGVDSVAHGLLLTFYNKYSIGWTRRGDEDGVFVAADLLKLVADKRATFDEYKSRF